MKIIDIKISVLILGVLLLSASSCSDDDSVFGDSYSTAVFNPSLTYGTLTDVDGNIYKTIKIGNQTWMAENLRTTKYNDGTIIPNVKAGSVWANLTSDAYCSYNNTTRVDSIHTYGMYYNEFAVKTGKLAPDGWHVPTEADWDELITHLGGKAVAGDKIKEMGYTHWAEPESASSADNSSGFTALPSGARIHGNFISSPEFNKSTYWWSSTEENGDLVIVGTFSNGSRVSSGASIQRLPGFNVRCVKD